MVTPTVLGYFYNVYVTGLDLCSDDLISAFLLDLLLLSVDIM